MFEDKIVYFSWLLVETLAIGWKGGVLSRGKLLCITLMVVGSGVYASMFNCKKVAMLQCWFLVVEGTHTSVFTWKKFNASVLPTPLFQKKIWKTCDLFVGPLIPIFWTSGVVFPGFKARVDPLFVCLIACM